MRAHHHPLDLQNHKLPSPIPVGVLDIQQVAIVTGGSRGIGRAISTRLATQGVSICVNYSAQQEPAEALVKELYAKGTSAIAVGADVSDPAQAQALIAELQAASPASIQGVVLEAELLRRQGEPGRALAVVEEALASGVPVVAPAAGGLLDVVADGETGLLYPPEDAEAMAAMIGALVDNPMLRRRMGRSARRAVQTRSWSAVMSTLVRHYREVVGVESEDTTPLAG